LGLWTTASTAFTAWIGAVLPLAAVDAVNAVVVGPQHSGAAAPPANAAYLLSSHRMLERPQPSETRRRARHARHRRCLKAGIVVAPVEIDGAVLDMLIRLRWLVERDAADRGKIGEAVARMLRDSAGA
jgi:hypothetical protein